VRSKYLKYYVFTNILLLPCLPMNEWLRDKHMMTNLAYGLDGKSNASQSDVVTSSWTASASKSKSFYSEHFAMAVRSRRYSDLQFNTLAEGTVRGTISNVVQTFRLLGRHNPTKDADNKLRILLLQQFQAFRNEYLKEKQQKALPFTVLNELVKCQVTETDKSITQLTIGAAFFACRSCEYSKVPKQEQKRTKLLCL
jgi:hypothetical protein